MKVPTSAGTYRSVYPYPAPVHVFLRVSIRIPRASGSALWPLALPLARPGPVLPVAVRAPTSVGVARVLMSYLSHSQK